MDKTDHENWWCFAFKQKCALVETYGPCLLFVLSLLSVEVWGSLVLGEYRGSGHQAAAGPRVCKRAAVVKGLAYADSDQGFTLAALRPAFSPSGVGGADKVWTSLTPPHSMIQFLDLFYMNSFHWHSNSVPQHFIQIIRTSNTTGAMASVGLV